MHATLTSRARTWIAGAAVALIVLLYMAAAWHHEALGEDAYISFRYAKNLAAGHGLRFNPDDPAPLEGYSNLLWVLVATPFEAAGVFPGRWLNGIAILCGALTVLLTGYTARRHLHLDRVPALGAMLFLGLLPPFVIWSTRGMETMPQTLFFSAAAIFLIFDDRRWALAVGGVAALCLALIRTEGFLWFPVFIGLAAVLRWLERRPLKPLFVVAAGVFAVWCAFAAWRLSYFGSLFAHTADAKLGGAHVWKLWVRGIRYVGAFVVALGTPILLVAAPLALRRSPWRYRILVVLALACACPAWAVLVGGDYMRWFRFVVPSTPFMALGLGVVYQLLWDALAPRRLGVLAAALMAGVAFAGHAPAEEIMFTPKRLLKQLSYDRDRNNFQGGTFGGHPHRPAGVPLLRHLRAPKVSLRDTLGKWTAVDAFTDAGDRVVMGGVGRNAYYSDVSVIDQCLLITPIPPRLYGILDAGAGRRPGHDNCVGAKRFQKKQPDVLYWTTHWVRNHQDVEKVREWLAHFQSRDKRHDHYADFRLVASTSRGNYYVVGLKRARSPEHRKRAMARVEQDVERLARGELKPFADALGRPYGSRRAREP